MISPMVSGSRICMATIFFYTCIWVPLLQIKQTLLTIFTLKSDSDHQHEVEQPLIEDYYYSSYMYSNDQTDQLPVCRFEELMGSNNSNRISTTDHDRDNGDQICSICLLEFEGEDVVTQMSRCGHVFHMDCIDKWIRRCHFTCPLCRSSLRFDRINTASTCDDQERNHL